MVIDEEILSCSKADWRKNCEKEYKKITIIFTHAGYGTTLLYFKCKRKGGKIRRG